MSHYVIGDENPKYGNRTLCGAARTRLDRALNVHHPSFEVQERFTPISCEGCLAVMTEARLLDGLPALCPLCMGKGRVPFSSAQREPEYVCTLCREGLVLTDFRMSSCK